MKGKIEAMREEIEDLRVRLAEAEGTIAEIADCADTPCDCLGCSAAVRYAEKKVRRKEW